MNPLFYLKFRNKFLASGDVFTSLFPGSPNTTAFVTEDEAVAKAVALGLDLNQISVIKVKYGPV